MSLRNSVRRGSALFSSYFRNYSSSGPLINVAVNEKTGVATATLNRPPVNSLNLELLTEISNTLSQLEKNKCRGLILTSSSKSVFSAGLDILEMYKPDPNRLKEWWTALQQTWLKLYGSSYPTVAVINGHAPAGGCLLSLSCEYRIMMNNFTIGLNETQLGIVAPPWFVASMKNVIGTRQTELALTTGNLFTTEEALKVGMIDEIASSKEDGIARAEKFCGRFARIPPVARVKSKLGVRGADIEALSNNLQKDFEYVANFVSQESVQKGLEMYLQSLKQKQKQ